MPFKTSSMLISCWMIAVPIFPLPYHLWNCLYYLNRLSYLSKQPSFLFGRFLGRKLFGDGFLGLNLLNWRPLPIELIASERDKYIFDVVVLLFRQGWTGLNDNLVPTHTVVQIIMDEFVGVRVEEEFVLFVVMLRTHPHGNGLVCQAMAHHCPEKFVSGACDFYHA